MRKFVHMLPVRFGQVANDFYISQKVSKKARRDVFLEVMRDIFDI